MCANMRPKPFLCLAYYYLFCGLTGLFLPVSWYWAAGLNVALPGLLVRITGAALLALGFAFVKAAKDSSYRPGVVLVAFWANIFDLIAVLIGVFQGELGVLQSAGFVFIDSFWIGVLYLMQRRLAAQKDSLLAANIN